MPSWKKVIVSGSDASLNSISTAGNISGSAASTGSFGHLLLDTPEDDSGQNVFLTYDNGDIKTRTGAAGTCLPLTRPR